MYCKSCGSEKSVKYRPAKGNSLCAKCSKEIPRKISREDFDRRYWKGDPDVPESTKREFYSDYKFSGSSFADYVKDTTTIL